MTAAPAETGPEGTEGGSPPLEAAAPVGAGAAMTVCVSGTEARTEFLSMGTHRYHSIRCLVVDLSRCVNDISE